MARPVLLMAAAALTLSACSPDEDLVEVYEESLRAVVEEYGGAGARMFVFSAYCEGAGGSEWPTGCQDLIPGGVQETLAQRLEGTIDVEFITNIDGVIHTEFNIIRGGGVLVLLGMAHIEGDGATLGLNWSDEDPRIQFNGWRLELRRSGNGWDVGDITETIGRIAG